MKKDKESGSGEDEAKELLALLQEIEDEEGDGTTRLMFTEDEQGSHLDCSFIVGESGVKSLNSHCEKTRVSTVMPIAFFGGRGFHFLPLSYT